MTGDSADVWVRPGRYRVHLAGDASAGLTLAAGAAHLGQQVLAEASGEVVTRFLVGEKAPAEWCCGRRRWWQRRNRA